MRAGGLVAGVGLITLTAAFLLGAAPSPRELGAVRWLRDFDAGLARARQSQRPVFLLFQEVPGCATCVGFGESVLSHPLLVEAIESEFVPVAVLNNRTGADAAVLRRYDEPAWNNPVVRFVDAEGADLIPRVDRVWSPGEIARRMIAALDAADRATPAYLMLAAEETRTRVPGRAWLEMHCFWQGEACLGALPGVVATEAAWLEGREVVDVRFDRRATSYDALLAAARSAGCAEGVFARTEAERRIATRHFGSAARWTRSEPRPAPAADQKRHLRSSPLRRLPLSPLQAVRVNAALARGADPLRWLSPRQRARLGPAS